MKTNIKSENMVLKHDALKDITSKFDTIDEHRFLNSCLQGNYQRNLLSESTYYPIDVRNYAYKSGLSIGAAYKELIILVKKYRDTELEVKLDESRTWCTSIIYDYIIDKDFHTIQVQFNKKIIPLISGDMDVGKFCMYDTRMDKVPSSRRYLMGELIQRNMWKITKYGFFTLKTSEIREELSLGPKEYEEFKALNRSIIQQSLEDLVDNLAISLKSVGNKYEVRFERYLGEVITKKMKKEKEKLAKQTIEGEESL